MSIERYPTRLWIDERVEIRPSPINGMGTFAAAPIAAGETEFVWGGTVFTGAEIAAGKARPGSVAAVDEGVYLAAATGGDADPSDFTNHSCDPNLWMADAVTLVARRDVAAGEELTGD